VSDYKLIGASGLTVIFHILIFTNNAMFLTSDILCWRCHKSDRLYYRRGFSLLLKIWSTCTGELII